MEYYLSRCAKRHRFPQGGEGNATDFGLDSVKSKDGPRIAA